MKTNLRALQSFVGPEGEVSKGQVFTVNEKVRADFLVNGGYAKSVTEAAAKKAKQEAPEPDPLPLDPKADAPDAV